MSLYFTSGIRYGYALVSTVASLSSLQFNTAGHRLAMRFVARHGGAPVGIAIRVTAVAGSVQEQHLVMAIHAVGSNGLPGSLIEERALGTTGTLTTGRKVVTGWQGSLTAWQQYFIVIRNTHSTPATDNFSIVYGVDNGFAGGDSLSPPGGSSTSTDGGSTWAGQGIQRVQYQIIYNTGGGDFTYDMLATSYIGTTALTSHPGVKFTTPADLKLRVIGVLLAQIGGISSSSWAIRIRQGGNEWTSMALSYGTSGAYSFVPMQGVIALEPNTLTKVQAYLTSGSAGTMRRADIDNTMLPTAFGFTGIEGYPTDSEVARLPNVMQLLLDPAQPFEVVGGGGGAGVFVPMTRVIM